MNTEQIEQLTFECIARETKQVIKQEQEQPKWINDLCSQCLKDYNQDKEKFIACEYCFVWIN